MSDSDILYVDVTYLGAKRTMIYTGATGEQKEDTYRYMYGVHIFRTPHNGYSISMYKKSSLLDGEPGDEGMVTTVALHELPHPACENRCSVICDDITDLFANRWVTNSSCDPMEAARIIQNTIETAAEVIHADSFFRLSGCVVEEGEASELRR